MRFKLLCAAMVGFALTAVDVSLAQAPAGTASGAQTSPPTVDELRRAVTGLRGDRIKRPASYDELTTEQKALVNSVLMGPRRGVDGSLGVMMVVDRFPLPDGVQPELKPLK